MAESRKAQCAMQSQDFLEVRKSGVSARAGGLTVAALSGSRRRLGIVVTRRIGNAVERNRLKRIIREYFRLNRETFPVGDCVVIPGGGSAKLTNDKLRENLGRALDLLARKLQV